MADASDVPGLVADVGATNARFGLTLSGNANVMQEKVLPCSAYPSISAAIEHYLAGIDGPPPRQAAIAIANPVVGDWVQMTNHVWAFSIEETRKSLGMERLIVLNDFTALAMALPFLPPAELRQVGGGQSCPGAPLALLGPGSGLGVSGLIPSPAGWVPLQGEGGHTSFCPANEREADILRIAWRERRHVSAERLISGLGMDNLYRAVAELHGQRREAPAPAEITASAMKGDDPISTEVVETFCAMLGTVAANLTLMLGARGGVYIGGGIVPKLGDYFDRSPFRRRFEDKGRFSEYLASIPSYVITAATPALLGAAQALEA